MQLIAIDYSGFMMVIGAAGFLVGVLTWWLSKLLTDKKEMTILQEQVKQNQDNIKNNREWFAEQIRFLNEKIGDVDDAIDDIEEEMKEWRQKK